MSGKLGLFAVTHWLLKAATVLTIIVAAALVLALGGLLAMGTVFDPSHFTLPAELKDIPRGELLALAGFAIAASLLCVVLVLFAILSTTRIIETAISGNPFVRENADRLMRIGWLLLALEVCGLLTNLTMTYVLPAKVIEKANLNFGFDMSPVGLLCVLLIFVLAQIFRHGSEM